jgi:hypothetical protein
MSNCCIKERKEERKMRGPRGAWKRPYLDHKGALGATIGSLRGPNQGTQGPQLGLLSGPIANFREPHQGL